MCTNRRILIIFLIDVYVCLLKNNYLLQDVRFRSDSVVHVVDQRANHFCLPLFHSYVISLQGIPERRNSLLSGLECRGWRTMVPHPPRQTSPDNSQRHHRSHRPWLSPALRYCESNHVTKDTATPRFYFTERIRKRYLCIKPLQIIWKSCWKRAPFFSSVYWTRCSSTHRKYTNY